MAEEGSIFAELSTENLETKFSEIQQKFYVSVSIFYFF